MTALSSRRRQARELLIAVALSGPLLSLQLMPAQDFTPHFVPQPQSVVLEDGHLLLSARLRIEHPPARWDRLDRPRLAAHAQVLADEIELLTGFRPRVAQEGRSRSAAPFIRLSYREAPPRPAPREDEELHSYALHIRSTGATIRADTFKGIAAGTSTLLQALDREGLRLRCLRIQDEPRYSWRSVSIDVARHPHQLSVLEDVIRFARLYRLRYLHLHLTDDQLFTFPFEPVTKGLPQDHPVYSRADLKHLVAYAEVRGITLVPEIDLPGHTGQMLRSGWLPGAKTHADVASEQHFKAITTLVDEVLELFAPSPFFHVGGDESGAGEALTPFLARMQKHLVARGRRMAVWEWFRDLPTRGRPPKGRDRILLMSWESSYNPPWRLLKAGYELVNASWKPLYIVGGHGLLHMGSSGRAWSPDTLLDWSVPSFQHWEAHRPVFEDRGPRDPNRQDSRWNARYIGREDQMVGAQMCVWEQRESSVITTLRDRLPIVAERTWSGSPRSHEELQRALASVDERLFALVQPVAIISEDTPDLGPLGTFLRHGEAGRTIHVRERVALRGQVRYSRMPFRGRVDWIVYPRSPDPMRATGATYSEPLTLQGAAAYRARWIHPRTGKPYGGGTFAHLHDWPLRVKVDAFALPRGGWRGAFPDLAKDPPGPLLHRIRMPLIRGPLFHIAPRAQLQSATLRPPSKGRFRIGLKTRSGRARLWLDLDGDGRFSSKERLIAETTPDEAWHEAVVQLDDTRAYALRIEHLSRLVPPTLVCGFAKEGAERLLEITPHLAPLEDQ